MPPCKDPIRALAERTALVDGMVERAARDKLWPAFPSGLALLAVGGYGRRHLFPYSDVDLLLLVESGRLAQDAPGPISAFLQSLWDSGLRLSHSVRTAEECAEIHDENIELNVSLLDQRYLAGDRALYGRFAERLPRFLHAQRDPLMRNLTRLSRERHQKYQNTYYHLEPNIKDTPGGLRDYQLVRWLAQIRNVEAPQIEPAFLFLARLRCFLHSRSGRDNNALTFDAQERAAEYFAAPGAAQWMRDYFRHARDLYRAAVRELELSEAQSSSLFAQFKDWRTRLSNADFSVARERVHLRVPHALAADPELALRLFQFAGRHGIRPSTETAVDLPVCAIQGLAHTPFERGFQRGARTRPLARAACIGGRSGTGAPPVSIRGAAWHPALYRDRPARRRRRAATGRMVFHAPAHLARAQGNSFAAIRRRRRAEHARHRRTARHLPRNGADRMSGHTRLLSSLHGGRAYAGHAAGSGRLARNPRTGRQALYRSAVGDGRARRAAVRAAVSRRGQGERERGARRGVPARGRAGPGAHRDAAARTRAGRLSYPAASGNVRRDELARPARPGHRASHGRARGNRGAPQGAHPDDLRGYQRRQSDRHDALARRGALAVVSADLQRAHARTGNRPHPQRPVGGARKARFPGGPADALRAHPHVRGDRCAPAPGRHLPPARCGRLAGKGGSGPAADPSERRPALPVRVGGRHALQLWHEYSEGGGIFEQPGNRAGYLHLCRSDAHAGAEPH